MDLSNIEEAKARMTALYGENHRITYGKYDKSLAVRCINGTFVGKKTDEKVIAFKGIPFVGKQPVGDLRWKAPVDIVPDDGVYEAYYFAKCPRQEGNVSQLGSLYPQDEDCLYLNVWKADDGCTEKKPVMVWIHGGAFEIGGTAEPREECTNFVRENPDVIVVSIEYRMNVFGFFHLSHLPDGGDFPDAQNLGLLDQVMALKWVHENIAAFGGDPEKVTIFGQSAGGKSYTYFFTPESSVPLMRSGHAIELSTVFNHPEETFVTGRLFDETFSKSMRRMWVQFAKTGNPSLTAQQSPDGKAKEWPLYDLEKKPVMIFDEFDIHAEKESERQIVDWERTYFLTKYYCI